MPDNQPYAKRKEDAEVLYCPYCGKSLIEFTGELVGFRIMCPGCEKVIVGWEQETNSKKGF